MSGLRPTETADFYRKLHARGMDTTALAAAVGRSRATVTRVLNGSRRRGPVWAKIRALLTEEERTLLDVAQSATWNTTRVARRPRWADVREILELNTPENTGGEQQRGAA